MKPDQARRYDALTAWVDDEVAASLARKMPDHEMPALIRALQRICDRCKRDAVEAAMKLKGGQREDFLKRILDTTESEG